LSINALSHLVQFHSSGHTVLGQGYGVDTIILFGVGLVNLDHLSAFCSDKIIFIDSLEPGVCWGTIVKYVVFHSSRVYAGGYLCSQLKSMLGYHCSKNLNAGIVLHFRIKCSNCNNLVLIQAVIIQNLSFLALKLRKNFEVKDGGWEQTIFFGVGLRGDCRIGRSEGFGIFPQAKNTCLLNFDPPIPSIQQYNPFQGLASPGTQKVFLPQSILAIFASASRWYSQVTLFVRLKYQSSSFSF